MSAKSRWPALRPSALLLLIVCIVRPGLPLGAQNRSVGGLVTDPNGAVLPGAVVTLREPESSQQRTVVTGADGQFSLSTPDGSSARLFNLVVDAPGFKPLERTIDLPLTGSTTPIVNLNFTVELLPLVPDTIVTQAPPPKGYTVVEDASSKLIALGEPEIKLNRIELEKLDSQTNSLSRRLASQFWEQTFDRWLKPENSIKNEAAVWFNPFEDVFRSALADSGKPAPKISLDARVDWHAMQTPAVNNAKPDPRKQKKTGAFFTDTNTVVTSHDPDRLTLPWLRRLLGLAAPTALGARGVDGRFMLRPIDPIRGDSLVIPPSQGRASDATAPGVKFFFVDTGQSSGASVQMTVVNEGTKPVTIVGGAFALEPVQGLSARDVARDIARLKGRKSVTVTLDAYCLNMKLPPPTADMVLRLVARPDPAVLAPLQKIVAAARKLYDAQQIKPDSDPLQYRHALLQWAIWTQEQNFTEQTFAQAFIDHSRENVEGAGQRWTPALDAAIRKLTPGRWRTIQRVFRLARLPMAGDAR